MIILSWNSAGAWAVLALGEIIKSRQPDILFLCETLVHSNKIRRTEDRIQVCCMLLCGPHR